MSSYAGSSLEVPLLYRLERGGPHPIDADLTKRIGGDLGGARLGRKQPVVVAEEIVETGGFGVHANRDVYGVPPVFICRRPPLAWPVSQDRRRRVVPRNVIAPESGAVVFHAEVTVSHATGTIHGPAVERRGVGWTLHDACLLPGIRGHELSRILVDDAEDLDVRNAIGCATGGW